ncbi:MAG: dienelactone hydrolase family protein [Bacteroidia bacterium]|nr:dienelactone hydrolase family protein [Bacteroidia bacterium]
MRNLNSSVFLIFLLISILSCEIISGQDSVTPDSIWQKPWDGVPEYYQKWNYPDYMFPENLSQWNVKRTEVQETLKNLLGDIPERPAKLKVKTISREVKNGYILEKFVIDNEIDSWIPGYLAIPANVKGKVPVIVGLHGHSSSKENIFGYNSNTAQDVMALLISNGYAVMAIDSYFNGDRLGTGPAGGSERQENGSDQELSQFKLNLWFGRSLWGMQLRDEQIAIDYLVSRPEIDAARIGVEGMSMGSTRAWWLAALDERIKVVVGVACFTRYRELIEQRQLKAHGIYYFVPGVLNHFDTEAIMGVIAPRPFLVLTGDSDAGSPLAGMKVLENKLNNVYSLYSKKENFRSIIYKNTGHVFTDEMKMEMLYWFKKHL